MRRRSECCFRWMVVALLLLLSVAYHRLSLEGIVVAADADLVDEGEDFIYVFGDLHGDYECAKYWLDKIGIVSKKNTDGNDGDDDTWIWSDQKKNSSIVFMGDYCDKGPQSYQVMQLVKSLTDQFPDRVTALMGNHELELLKDRDLTEKTGSWTSSGGKYHQLPYATVHPAEYLNYLSKDQLEPAVDELVIDALYNASMEVYGMGKYRSVTFAPRPDGNKDSIKHPQGSSILDYIPSASIRSIAKERLTLYQKTYLEAFQPSTELGQWLQSRPILHLEENILFVHGGVSPYVAQSFLSRGKFDVKYINDSLLQQTKNNNEEDVVKKINQFLSKTTLGHVIYDLVTQRDNHPPDNYRSNSGGHYAQQSSVDDDPYCTQLSQLLKSMKGVKRLAVGHTPDWDVRLHCNNQFMALDSLLGRWIRIIGNDYCQGGVPARTSSNGRYRCEEITSQCEGQITRISKLDGYVEVIDTNWNEDSHDEL